MNLPYIVSINSLIRVGLPMLTVSMITALPAVGQLPDPVAHWTFDEGIENYALDTAIDNANGNNGIWQNSNTDGLEYAAGQIGGAVRLRGDENDFFEIPSIPQIDGIEPTPFGPTVLGVGITFSAWINIDQDTPAVNKGILVSRDVTDETLAGFESGQNWGFNWAGGDQIDFRVSGNPGGTASNPDSIGRDQWHHVAMVWGNVDDSTSNIPPSQIIYVDGVRQDNSIPDTGVFKLVTSGAWLIGNDNCCAEREFEGLIDDVAIFAEALTDSDIALLHGNGAAGIDAAEVSTGIILPGDVDGGGVSITDFQIIRDNMGLEVNARSSGDLNGNRRVDLGDFRVWLNEAPPALAAEALASMSVTVPEPASVQLLLAATLFFLGRRRDSDQRTQSQQFPRNMQNSPAAEILQQMIPGWNFRRAIPVLLTVLLTMVTFLPGLSRAQDLVLRVDRETGAMQLTGASATVVDLAGYSVVSSFGTLDPGSGNFTGLRVIDSNWVLAGVPSATSIAELVESGDPTVATEVDNSLVFDLGNLYDPSTAIANGGFGFNVEDGDLTLTYADLNLPASAVGLVEYVGDSDRNTLVLTVDTGTGEASIENESSFDQDLIGYSIVAGTSGILNTNLSTFTGLRDDPGGSSFQPPAVLTGDALSELDPTVDQNVAGISIDAGQSYDLGVIGDVSGNLGDLVDNLNFSFLLAGESELNRTGFVRYSSPGGGDFDGDGDVDGADFLAWQRGESPDPLSATDLQNWEASYGGGSSIAAATAAVPEPSSSVLVLIVLVGGALARNRVS